MLVTIRLGLAYMLVTIALTLTATVTLPLNLGGHLMALCGRCLLWLR